MFPCLFCIILSYRRLANISLPYCRLSHGGLGSKCCLGDKLNIEFRILWLRSGHSSKAYVLLKAHEDAVTVQQIIRSARHPFESFDGVKAVLSWLRSLWLKYVREK